MPTPYTRHAPLSPSVLPLLAARMIDPATPDAERAARWRIWLDQGLGLAYFTDPADRAGAEAAQRLNREAALAALADRRTFQALVGGLGF